MRHGGHPQQTPEEHAARGTKRNDRHGGLITVAGHAVGIAGETGSHLALEPTDITLTEHGADVWVNEIEKVYHTRMAEDFDSTAFGNYCNIQGAINNMWRQGAVPPVALLAECRKMQEQFGLFGVKSRIVKKDSLSKAPGENANRFASNGRKVIDN